MGEVIDERIRRALAHAHTNIPAKVIAYEPITNTVVAQPVTKAPFTDSHGELEYDELPAIPNVPVMWPRGGGNVIRMKLDAGDFVWLSFSEAALSEWRVTGQLSEPADARRHSIGYPFAIPGAFPDVALLSPLDAVEIAAGAILIGEDGGTAQMIVGGLLPGVRFGKLAISPVALAVPLMTCVASMAAAGAAAGAADSSVSAALVAIQAALAAIVAIPANAAAAAAVGASGTAVGTAGTSTAASAAAATAASAAAATAAGAVPSTLVKSV